MNLEGIIAISGKPGLFKIIAQTKTGVVVESLLDKKRFAMSSSLKMSALQDIAIYTYTEEVPLSEVLDKISAKESGNLSIGHKSSKDILINYFNEILEDYDENRVYVSDIKKVISWYNTLNQVGLVVSSGASESKLSNQDNQLKKNQEKEKSISKSSNKKTKNSKIKFSNKS